MQTTNSDEVLDQIVARDPRYAREAYLFVREALDYTQKLVSKGGRENVRHVTGQELLEGIRQYALEHLGPMTMLVLEEWGVTRGEDFGEIVFNMVDAHLLAKTKKDTREDFKSPYAFFEAFRQPFLPQSRRCSPVTAREARPTEG